MSRIETMYASLVSFYGKFSLIRVERLCSGWGRSLFQGQKNDKKKKQKKKKTRLVHCMAIPYL